MKIFFKLLTLSTFSLFLLACSADQTKTEHKETKSQNQVQLVVKEDTNTIDEKVSFNKGDTVMDVLKANYTVKEKDGFITEIDGHKQNPKEQKYWLFKVNGKMAAKAANQLKVKQNDKIEFYIEKMK